VECTFACHSIHWTTWQPAAQTSLMLVAANHSPSLSQWHPDRILARSIPWTSMMNEDQRIFHPPEAHCQSGQGAQLPLTSAQCCLTPSALTPYMSNCQTTLLATTCSQNPMNNRQAGIPIAIPFVTTSIS
jgi:hypothetical protein